MLFEKSQENALLRGPGGVLPWYTPVYPCDYRTGVPECADGAHLGPRAVGIGGFLDLFSQLRQIPEASSLQGRQAQSTSVCQAKHKKCREKHEKPFPAKSELPEIKSFSGPGDLCFSESKRECWRGPEKSVFAFSTKNVFQANGLFISWLNAL